MRIIKSVCVGKFYRLISNNSQDLIAIANVKHKNNEQVNRNKEKETEQNLQTAQKKKQTDHTLNLVFASRFYISIFLTNLDFI